MYSETEVIVMARSDDNEIRIMTAITRMKTEEGPLNMFGFRGRSGGGNGMGMGEGVLLSRGNLGIK